MENQEKRREPPYAGSTGSPTILNPGLSTVERLSGREGEFSLTMALTLVDSEGGPTVASSWFLKIFPPPVPMRFADAFVAAVVRSWPFRARPAVPLLLVDFFKSKNI